MSKKKKPACKKSPKGSKQIGKIQTPNFEKQKISWQIGSMDIFPESPWGWKEISKEKLWDNLFPKLQAFETMTWSELGENGSHSVSFDSLIPKAQKRLEDLKIDDIDELYSLRLTGKERIWGVRDRNILKLLWWDPTPNLPFQ